MRHSWETITSVTAGHIILTPTQPVGSGRSQRQSNPEPPHQESRALPTELPSPPPPPQKKKEKKKHYECVGSTQARCKEKTTGRHLGVMSWVWPGPLNNVSVKGEGEY